MLSKLEQAKQEWGGTLTAIDNWLNERQEVLVGYCELAGLPPNERGERNLPDINKVQEFCQLLVDYVSTGHFEVYDQVVSKCETHGGESAELAKMLYPKISETTDTALAFNDKYAELGLEEEMLSFDTDLSNLGQMMEARFALEDEMLRTLHIKHSE